MGVDGHFLFRAQTGYEIIFFVALGILGGIDLDGFGLWLLLLFFGNSNATLLDVVIIAHIVLSDFGSVLG